MVCYDEQMISESTKSADAKLEHARTRMFMLMLEIGAAFAVPAVLAAVGGKYLDTRYNTENTWVIGLLALAFITSWSIVIVRYRAVSTLLRDTKNREQHTS